MALVKLLSAEFEKSLTAVFEREQQEPKYLKQTVLGCRWRAFKGLTIAFLKCLPTMVNLGAYAIAKHRQEEHGEDKTTTIRSIAKKLTGDKIKSVSETNTGWMV